MIGLRANTLAVAFWQRLRQVPGARSGAVVRPRSSFRTDTQRVGGMFLLPERALQHAGAMFLLPEQGTATRAGRPRFPQEVCYDPQPFSAPPTATISSTALAGSRTGLQSQEQHIEQQCQVRIRYLAVAIDVGAAHGTGLSPCKLHHCSEVSCRCDTIAVGVG